MSKPLHMFGSTRNFTESRWETSVLWCTFSISATAMLLGSFAGSIGAYAFLGLWLLFAAARAKPSFRALTYDWRSWVFPGFALLSVLWSQSAGATLRYAIEYAATAGCAMITARLLSPRNVISALMMCLLVIAILSLALGKTAIDGLTGSVDFVGVFESKNELAFFVSLMLLATGAVLLDREQHVLFRLIAVVSLAPVLPLLVKTHSATSQVTSALALLVLFGSFVLAQLKSRERALLIGAGVMMTVPLLALLDMAGQLVSDFIVHVLGKDTTLTGRTTLWHHAGELIPQHPLLGWGWHAFWRQNSVDAESLWNEFHIASRQGFHFHDTYIETTIELGYIGCAILVLVLLATILRVMRWNWRDRSIVSSFYVALIACLVLRSVVEIDILFEFQIGTFMFFVAMCCAFDRGRAVARGPQPASAFPLGRIQRAPT